jgi:NAD(P)H dehydrogenase (quinone)
MYLVTGAAGHLGQAVINHLINTYKVPANKIIATHVSQQNSPTSPPKAL